MGFRRGRRLGTKGVKDKKTFSPSLGSKQPDDLEKGLMSYCETCGSDPCRNPSFCRLCADADRRKKRPPADDLAQAGTLGTLGMPTRIVSSPALARRQLNGILRTIAGAREGERNTLTFWGACRLAEMVQRGELSRNDAIALTIEAASRTGLTRSEAEGRIKSAFRTTGV
jgi:hypothetical protein